MDKTSPKYGKGAVSLDFSECEVIDPADVLARLRAVFLAPDYRPPRLPAAATQLLELTKKTDVEMSEVTSLLEQDQLLAAQVLRLAQSVAHAGRGEPVRTLGEALVRLGLRRTADIFLEVCLQMRVFRVAGYQSYMNDLRRHSAAVAHVARLVSRETALFDEHAFLCGLLHDVGIAASLIAIADSTPRGKQVPDFSQIWRPIRECHHDAGANLGRVWGLPEDVLFAIKHHHHCVVGGYPHPTSCVVEVSGALVEESGLGFGQEAHQDSVQSAMGGLGLGERDMKRIRAKVGRLLRDLGLTGC